MYALLAGRSLKALDYPTRAEDLVSGKLFFIVAETHGRRARANVSRLRERNTGEKKNSCYFGETLLNYRTVLRDRSNESGEEERRSYSRQFPSASQAELNATPTHEGSFYPWPPFDGAASKSLTPALKRAAPANLHST